jgi:hypothetical protein
MYRVAEGAALRARGSAWVIKSHLRDPSQPRGCPSLACIGHTGHCASQVATLALCRSRSTSRTRKRPVHNAVPSSQLASALWNSVGVVQRGKHLVELRMQGESKCTASQGTATPPPFGSLRPPQCAHRCGFAGLSLLCINETPLRYAVATYETLIAYSSACKPETDKITSYSRSPDRTWNIRHAYFPNSEHGQCILYARSRKS